MSRAAQRTGADRAGTRAGRIAQTRGSAAMARKFAQFSACSLIETCNTLYKIGHGHLPGFLIYFVLNPNSFLSSGIAR